MKKKSTIQVYFITIIAALGGFLFGYDTGVIGGTQLYFTEYLKLTSGEQGWAVSSALYGCLIGALLAGYLSNKISRKYTLIVSAFLFALSAWGSGLADSLTALSVYRIIGGVGVGIASMTAPMYIAEIAPADRRGLLVTIYQLAVVLGFFIVFLVTYFIGGQTSAELTSEVHQYNITKGWRVMFWSELVPALTYFIALFFIPHSPRWLMLKSRDQEATLILNKFNKDKSVTENEIYIIRQSLNTDFKPDYFSVFKKRFRFILFIGIALTVLQQTTGINAILYYGAEIFSNVLGYGPEDALKQQLWLGGVNLLFTFIAIFSVDRWGRKPLLIIGSFGMFVSLTILGLSIYFKKFGLLSLVSMLSFIGSFALSMGPVVWVLISEIFPNSIRNIGMSIAVTLMWFANAIVANTFPIINRSNINHEIFNNALPYFVFAISCLLALVFIWKYVPETKGRTLEQIESDLRIK